MKPATKFLIVYSVRIEDAWYRIGADNSEEADMMARVEHGRRTDEPPWPGLAEVEEERKGILVAE